MSVRCLETTLPKSRSSSWHQDQPTSITRLSVLVRMRLLRVSMLLVLLVAGLVAILLVRGGVEPNPGPNTKVCHACKILRQLFHNIKLLNINTCASDMSVMVCC